MPAHEMKSARLEAFSDGVIAVIITIMVLELHVPEASGFAGLWHVVPRLAIYALSFLMVGVYWVNHHELCRRTEVVNDRILYANLLFLFTLSLLPYFTDYVAEHHYDSFTTALYVVVIMIVANSFLVLRFSLNCLRKRANGEVPQQDRIETKKHLMSMSIYLLALAASYYKPLLALLIVFSITMFWIVPELGTKHPGAHRPRHFPEVDSR